MPGWSRGEGKLNYKMPSFEVFQSQLQQTLDFRGEALTAQEESIYKSTPFWGVRPSQAHHICVLEQALEVSQLMSPSHEFGE